LSNGEITADIERFIHDNIISVEQLEILLLLASPPQKEWSAIEVSQKLYRQPDSVTARLEDLRDRGILSVRQEAQLFYRYVSNAPQDAIVRGLNRAYEVRKDAIIRLIFTRPPDTLRAFSDAFRIRRDG
jgi:hypothetical protein